MAVVIQTLLDNSATPHASLHLLHLSVSLPISLFYFNIKWAITFFCLFMFVPYIQHVFTVPEILHQDPVGTAASGNT